MKYLKQRRSPRRGARGLKGARFYQFSRQLKICSVRLKSLGLRIEIPGWQSLRIADLGTRKILRRKEMRYSRSLKLFALVAALIALVTSGVVLFAQETTGGLQGTIKDASGAVVAGAHVEVKGTTLVGE